MDLVRKYEHLSILSKEVVQVIDEPFQLLHSFFEYQHTLAHVFIRYVFFPYHYLYGVRQNVST